MTDADRSGVAERATICPRCGAGLLDGKHIASYPPCNGSDASSILVLAATVAEAVLAEVADLLVVTDNEQVQRLARAAMNARALLLEALDA